jgi:hypothetical protein
MTEIEPIDIRRHLAMVWGKLMIEQQYVGAALTGLLGHIVARHNKNGNFETESMAWVRKAMEELESGSSQGQSFNDPVCSFCGRGKHEVRLVGGANAFICEDCVKTVGEAFIGKNEK